MIRDYIQSAQNGDSVAFSYLYDLTYTKVYTSIFHRTLDTLLTEDIVSIVYTKMLKNVKNFRWETEGEFFSWILRIGYTTMIDVLKKNNETDSLDESPIEPWYSLDDAREIDDKDTLMEVMNFMKTLSERDRSILTLRIWDDLSYEEISKITGESISNTKKIVSRSLQKIVANVSYILLFTILLNYVYHR